jgi:glycosyltransferase involved in cell wall biosynthesis
MKIFVVLDEMNSPHGTEMLAALFVDQAVRRGFTVHLFTAHFSSSRSKWRKFLSERNVTISQPGFWFGTARFWPHRVMAWRLWRAVAKARPSLIWSPGNFPMTSHALAAMPLTGSPPFFVHVPGEAGPSWPHPYQNWFDVCHRVSGLTAHGQRQAKGAKEYYRFENPIEVVWPASFPPGREILPPRENGMIRFGLFGRFASMKGHLFAIGAFARLREMGQDAELLLYGDGPMIGTARELVNSLDLSKAVRFCGDYTMAQLDDLVETVDVGLMPSFHEGFGIVMLDLMSRGRPVIATEVGSSREVLGDLGGGWVVKRADTESLVQAMLYCCQHRQATIDTGKKAQAVWQNNFTPEKMFNRYLAFWEKCGLNLNQH